MARDRKKTVAVELTAPTGTLDRDLKKGVQIVRKRSREAQREANKIGRGVTGSGPGRSSPMGGVRGRVGGAVKGAIAFGGFYGLQGEIRKAKAFEETLVDIAVRGKKTRGWMTALRKEVLSVSNQYGMGKEKLAQYVQGIVDQTGNVQLAVGSLKTMTSVAYATNADIGELAGTVMQLQQNLKIGTDDMNLAFGVLASQADSGAVALDQMAGVLPVVLASATRFGHTGVKALRDYGAALQFARRGTGDVRDAATALNNAMVQIGAKQGTIERSLDISLQTNGRWKSLGEILRLISSKLAEIQKRGGKVNIFNKKGKKIGSETVTSFLGKKFGIRGQKLMTAYLAQAHAGFGNSVGGLSSLNAITGAGDANTIGERVKLKRQLNPNLDAWDKAITRFQNQMHRHALPALRMVGDYLPKMANAAVFLLTHWKKLLALWAGQKMTAFFLNMSRAAQGGGGGGTYYAGGGGRGKGWSGRKRKGKPGTKGTPKGSGGGGGLGWQHVPLIGAGIYAAQDELRKDPAGFIDHYGNAGWQKDAARDIAGKSVAARYWGMSAEEQRIAREEGMAPASVYREQAKRKYQGLAHAGLEGRAKRFRGSRAGRALQGKFKATVGAPMPTTEAGTETAMKSLLALRDQYDAIIARQKESMGGLGGAVHTPHVQQNIYPEIVRLAEEMAKHRKALEGFDLSKQLVAATKQAFVAYTTATRTRKK